MNRLFGKNTVLVVTFIMFPWNVIANVNWHGFVAQGLIHTKDTSFVDPDDEFNLKLTELGINGSIDLTPSIRIAGQAVYLNGGNRYPEGARLDYLFADFDLFDETSLSLNLHLGRYKNYHWLYSATRDVPHTRPSIILPQSVYFDGFRDIAVGSDGAALVGNYSNNIGEWEFNWSYGNSPVSRDQTRDFFSDLSTGSTDQDFVHQFSTFLSPNAGPLQIGISLMESDFSYNAGEQDVLQSGLATVQRFMLTMQYAAEKWDLTSEILQERVIFRGILAPGFLRDSLGQGGYVQARYFLSPQITLLARIDLLDLDKDDRNGTQLQATTGIPNHFGFHDTGTLGLTWHVQHNFRLQAEYHRVRGAGRINPSIFQDVANNSEEYNSIFALQATYWF